MRIRPEKIHDLAEQIVALLHDHPKAHPQADDAALKVTIGSVLLDDMREEEDIDREVDALISKHSSTIDSEDLDVDALRTKFKSEIARQRGFVL